MTDNFDDIFQNVGNKYGIDPALLKSQAMVESQLDPSAVGTPTPNGQAHGISQIMPDTAKSLGVDPSDPAASIDAQARLLKENLARYGTPEKAILAYHGGTDPNNWGPKTQKYLQNVSDNYAQLKNAQPPSPKALEAQDDFEREVLGVENNAKTPVLEPQDDFEKEALAVASTPLAASAPPVETKPTATVPVPSDDKPLFRDVTQDSGMEEKAATTRAETAYGFGDIPRSVANVVAKMAPKTYGYLASNLSPAYQAMGGQALPTTPEALSSALQARNQEFEQTYGNDSQAHGNRLAGQIVGSLPVMGAGGKALGAVGNAATRVSSTMAQWAAESPLANFLGGKVASNAVVNPATGAVIKGASVGNRLAQYAASGFKGATLAAPLTALTNAGSDASGTKQLAQNAIGGGILGAASPTAFDAGVGVANSAKQLLSGASGIEQKANSVLNELVGGNLGKLDTTEYVPGSKPTLAQASDNPNVAALDRVLKEGNPSAGELTIPELTNVERQQETARRTYLDTITGSPNDLQGAKDARSAAANLLLYGHPDGEAAAAVQKVQPSVWEQSIKPTNVQPVVDKIENILKGPDRKNDAVVSALTDIKNKLVNDNGSLEADPETLYRSVVKDINTKLDRANPIDSASQNMQAATAQVQKIKSALNDSISESTPGYKNYLQTYAKLSQPIDEMNVLQNKLDFLNQPGDQGIPTLAKVNSALKAISKNKAGSGFSQYDSVLPATVNKLQNLQKDLQRAQRPTALLRNVGSPTDPKIASRKKVENLLNSKLAPKLAQAGRGMGATAGAVLGERLGGTWAAGAGAGLGEMAGDKLGQLAGNLISSDKSAVTNQLSKMMLSPQAASASASRMPTLLPGVGNLPDLQNALSYASPYAAIEANQKRNLQRSTR